MSIKAIGFDIGNTLVHYKNPLNWQSLYTPAITEMAAACGMEFSEEAAATAREILTRYNTRVNFRTHEVSSEKIFSEILRAWKLDLKNLRAAKRAFFSFFRRDAACYDDTEETLRGLGGLGLKIGFLTDVAYGMDNEIALEDVAEIIKYADICLTSNDVGFRKPHEKGFLRLQEVFGARREEIAFVGDEEKDIAGANAVGFVSILIDRERAGADFGQKFTIHRLSDLLRHKLWA